MARPEVISDDVRLALGAAQVGAHAGHHLALIGGPAPSHGVRLHVLVEPLVGVELRAVGRQVEEPDAPGVLAQPLLERPRAVHRVAVHDQEHLSLHLPEEQAEEADEHPRREAAPEHHEGELPPVRDRGEHVAAEALASAWNHRGSPLEAEAASRLMVAPEAHLIAPVNPGLLPLRLPAYGRVFLPQPARHRPRVLLVGPAERLLRREAPAVEPAAHRPHRHLAAEALGQEPPHRLARPERKGQLQLVGAAAGDRAPRLRFLARREARGGRPSPPARAERIRPASAVLAHPGVHRLARDAEHPRRLGLREASPGGSDHPPPERLLRIRGKVPRIVRSHGPKHNRKRSKCQTFCALINNYLLYRGDSEEFSQRPDFESGRARRPRERTADLSSVAFLQDTLQVLFGLLASTMLPAKPNPAHLAIRDYAKEHPNCSIVTTNYDCCMDLA